MKAEKVRRRAKWPGMGFALAGWYGGAFRRIATKAIEWIIVQDSRPTR